MHIQYKTVFAFFFCLAICQSAVGQEDLELLNDGIVLPMKNPNLISSPIRNMVSFDAQRSALRYYDGSAWTSFRSPLQVSTDFIFGRDSLPDDGELVSDHFFFFDKGEGAFRGGNPRFFGDPTAYWDQDSLGRNSFAFGQGARATGNISIALGDRVTASGYASVALGLGATAEGGNAVAIGRETKAMGIQGSVARGFKTVANGTNGSTAIGEHTISNARGGLAVGRFNDPLITPQTSPQDPIPDNTPYFIVGNGADQDNRRNALEVYKDGRINVGPGANRQGLLHLGYLSSGDDPHLRITQTDGTFSRITMENTDAPEKFWTIATTEDAIDVKSQFNIWYQDAEESGSNLLQIRGTGDAILAGNLTENSDRRLKEAITRLSEEVTKIYSLKGYSYYWKESHRSQREQLGFIAQEVQELFPQLVYEDEAGILSVDYISLIPVLVEALKQEKRERSNLEGRVANLEKWMVDNLPQVAHPSIQAKTQ